MEVIGVVFYEKGDQRSLLIFEHMVRLTTTIK
jgi:hypothetical protein